MSTIITADGQIIKRKGPPKGTMPKNLSTLYTPELNKRRSEKSMGRPAWNKGKKMSVEACKKMSKSRTGEKHFAWKGADVSYSGIHHWVSRWLGKPKECESCGLKDIKRTYHWANKSGKYRRELEDWIRMCVPCHSFYDRHHNKNL